jgi:large subunit ribosomal protein L10
MKREDKNAVIDQLKEKINNSKHFYLADIGGLDASETSALRRQCFNDSVSLVVTKNTLLREAMVQAEGDFEELYSVLAGPTSIMFTETGNVPAKLIKAFLKKNDKGKPVFKGAYVEESIYLGEDQLDVLVAVKSKEELVADVIALLQSPLRNVISSLESGKSILAGVVKTLGEKEN